MERVLYRQDTDIMLQLDKTSHNILKLQENYIVHGEYLNQTTNWSIWLSKPKFIEDVAFLNQRLRLFTRNFEKFPIGLNAGDAIFALFEF